MKNISDPPENPSDEKYFTYHLETFIEQVRIRDGFLEEATNEWNSITPDDRKRFLTKGCFILPHIAKKYDHMIFNSLPANLQQILLQMMYRNSAGDYAL